VGEGLWTRGRTCGHVGEGVVGHAGAWGAGQGRRQHRVSPIKRERIVSSFDRIVDVVFPKVKMRNAKISYNQ
jgi:hypothetical protein